ncbi:MAG TPA: hypothetical protein VMI10_00770 [Terriglobales bacterium]|nr:hypothetical protein [Terriglobales bacterium]
MTSSAPVAIDTYSNANAKELQSGEILAGLRGFLSWLDKYGETSYDFQTFYASDLCRNAKALYYRQRLLGTIAVAPIIVCEAFVPSARKLFWKPQRFPIADAHYAMGFAFLAKHLNDERYYQRALHFLQVLEETRCPGYERYCWGYPFNWETIRGTIREGTPLITTVPYVYEAFREVYRLDHDDRWWQVMHSIAEHGLRDYKDFATSERAASCSYSPIPEHSVGVVNANAYRAFLLTQAAMDFSERSYQDTADRNLCFVLESQNADGSWHYANDGKRHFVDHFHTCFVMKALAKIEALTGNADCTKAIERGIEYYVKNLFDERGLPKPFSRPPRLIVYRRELYDYAECINLGALLRGRFEKFDRIVDGVVNEVLTVWQRTDGSFRTRQLLLGWDNVPMHRWAQAQLFRSLCLLMLTDAKAAGRN